MTAADLAAPAQPATPGQALRDFRIVVDIDTTELVTGPDDGQLPELLNAIHVAVEDYVDLDAFDVSATELPERAPTTYSLPAEPPESEVWDHKGIHWRRDGDETHHGYHFWINDRGWVLHYPELLMRQYPLSTAPPAGTAGER